MNPPTVTFVITSNDTHIEALRPVAQILREGPLRARCEALSLVEYFFPEPTDRRRLGACFASIRSLDKLCHRRGLARLRRLCGRSPRLLRAVERMEKGALPRAIRAEAGRPGLRALVVANDRPEPVRRLIQECRGRGIPSLLVQESIRKDEAFGDKKRSVYGQGGCDRIAAWGESSRDYFQRVGADGSRIAITGNPRIDAFERQCRALSRAETRRKLGLPEEARVVLLATNPVDNMGILTEAQYRAALDAAMGAAAQAGKNVWLAVKPHPLERARFREWGISQVLTPDAQRVYLEDAGLPEAIVACDAVIVFNSTVALEAGLLNRDVGILNLHGADYGMDFSAFGIAVPLSRGDCLERFVSGALGVEPAERARGMSRLIACRGQAAERIAAEIVGMLEGATPGEPPQVREGGA